MRTFSVLVAALALVACKSNKPSLVLDAATVEERLAHLEADVPTCHTVDPSSQFQRGRPVAQASVRQIGNLLETMRLLRAEPIPYAGVASTGSCGGNLDVSFEHESGITDYVAQMAAYCVPSPEGDLVYNGTIKAKETGTPSDAGPVIKKLELSTDGPVTLTQGTETLEITIEDVQTDYGIPAEFEPSFPDEANPDKTSIGAVRVTYEDGREDYVEDLELERVGGIRATVRVLSGRSGSSVDGFATVKTAEADPLIVDVYTGTVQSGTLELTGKKNTMVTVSPRPENPATYTVTIDGVPIDETVDCSPGESAKVETVRGLLEALPIY